MGLHVTQINHHVLSVDAQPSGCGGLVILVTGHVRLDGAANALYFSHMFHLIPVYPFLSSSVYILESIRSFVKVFVCSFIFSHIFVFDFPPNWNLNVYLISRARAGRPQCARLVGA